MSAFPSLCPFGEFFELYLSVFLLKDIQSFYFFPAVILLMSMSMFFLKLKFYLFVLN